MPLDLSTGAAAGDARNCTSSPAAPGSFAALPTPAAKPIQVCNASGSGPAISMPGTFAMRGITTTTMSASPRATTSTVSLACIGLSFGFMSAAMPRRSSRLTK